MTDPKAEFERLLAELRPRLHRYCARMTGSVIDGEDVLQETLVKAIEAFPRKVEQAAREYEPSVVSKHLLDLAGAYNGFNSAHRITRRATVKDDPSRVPPAHPRARMTLVSSQRLGGLKETMGVRRHLISRPTL